MPTGIHVQELRLNTADLRQSEKTASPLKQLRQAIDTFSLKAQWFLEIGYCYGDSLCVLSEVLV